MHPEWIKRSFPWPGVLTSLYLSFSPKTKKFYRISKSPFFWGLVCLRAIVIQCNWILLYCFCFIVATCNSKVRLLGMRNQWWCACMPCICVCEREGVKETPEETAEQEQIVKSAVPRRSNWGTWCFCQASKTHIQIWPQHTWVLRGRPCSSPTVQWQQGCSVSRPAAGRGQQKFTPVKGMSKNQLSIPS